MLAKIAINDGLHAIRNAASDRGDGNTVALMDRITRDVASISGYDGTDLDVLPESVPLAPSVHEAASENLEGDELPSVQPSIPVKPRPEF